METVTKNTETESVEKMEIGNENGLGLFWPFSKINVSIRYFTVGNKLGIFSESIKSELTFINS
jgi:hypothetical protein